MSLMFTSVNSGVENQKSYLVNKLRDLGYTVDRVGKRTRDMTLPELEQIYINLQYKQKAGTEI
ncbi:hypothetical protein [Halobacillus sp. BBL2006]|uniref:hypothetical protein n=1 Tax=Halobacillus sp. BBL2006 TaxID=1543706 RepID=UPI0005426375|nr:hypothetical protein [Halobacillus sp. BBL2006]KHE66854.1 hypothetical protein LD39_20575 [Halobacillus sp. BBL2006]